MQDPDLARAGYYAIESNKVVQSLSPERQIAWAREQVEKFFPEKFAKQEQPREQPKEQRPSRVDAGGLATGAPQRERGWDQLPPSAKQAAQEFFEAGQFGFQEDPAGAKRKYAATLLEPIRSEDMPRINVNEAKLDRGKYDYRAVRADRADALDGWEDAGQEPTDGMVLVRRKKEGETTSEPQNATEETIRFEEEQAEAALKQSAQQAKKGK